MTTKISVDANTAPHRGGCSDRDCICWTKRYTPCEGFCGDGSSLWCVRCGWHIGLHSLDYDGNQL